MCINHNDQISVHYQVAIVSTVCSPSSRSLGIVKAIVFILTWEGLERVAYPLPSRVQTYPQLRVVCSLFLCASEVIETQALRTSKQGSCDQRVL